MHILYNVIIEPLVIVYDVLFTILFRSFQNPIISIMGLSVVINIIVLPLYEKADILQKEEQSKQLKMRRWANHIRHHFKDDEKFLILSAYYKIEHYSPISFFKEAVPLLLQIPFFIAAYRFISSLSIFSGTSFGPISDLSKPDGLLSILGLKINALPILMTSINLISGAIYSKGSTIRVKIQLIVTALVFLVFLYNSPSALVIYWTMNNIFSLVKNIVHRFLKRGKQLTKIILGLFVFTLVEVLAFNGRIQTEIAVMLIICSLCYVYYEFRKMRIVATVKTMDTTIKRDVEKNRNRITIITEFTLAVLLGLYIPSSVLSSSPGEFIDKTTGCINYDLLIYPASVYLGMLLLWMSVIYFSAENGDQFIISVILSSALVFSLINQFIFSTSFGTLYTDLTFDGTVSFPIEKTIINGMIGVLSLIICSYLFYRRPRWLKNILIITCAALICLVVCNNITIHKENAGKKIEISEVRSYDGVLHLSKNGKNVIVFMLDRAIGSYVPYIFKEKVELKKSYEGFVYYPNTLSFGICTNYGAPGLFGGYEYTPVYMNKRSSETLMEKHNQALKLMPFMFSNNGYDVTVCDPPYAGYKSKPDLSIYDGIPRVSAYNLEGVFSKEFLLELDKYDLEYRQKRNFVMYGLFRVSPLMLRSFIYDNGTYIHNTSQIRFTDELIDNYSMLDRLIRLTSIDESQKDNFLLLQNATPHNPTSLKPPDYNIEIEKIDSKDSYAESKIDILEYNGRKMDVSTSSKWNHYCINIATYKEVAKWLDYLREQNVYDNTRIILVADHGYPLNQFSDFNHPEGLDVEGLNPLLLIKDFDSHDPFTISNQFMTNADVPYLAMKDIIKNPVNPFTGNIVSNELKKGMLYVTDSRNWDVSENNGYKFDLGGGHWWSIHDNIFDMSNWHLVSEEEVEG